MSKKGGSGSLGGAKGGDLLRLLADRMAAPKTASVQPSARSQVASSDDRLLEQMQSRRPPAPAASTHKPATKKASSQKAAPKKEVLKVPSGFKAAMIEAARAAAPLTSYAPTPKMSAANDFGDAAFRRIAGLRSTLEHFHATHRAQTEVSSDTRNLIEQRILRGAVSLAGIVESDDGYFVGYDFGTSTTKAVLRHPYRPGEAFAVPVPVSWASRGQPHLWPTAIWYNAGSQQFSLLPKSGWICLQGFKSALIEAKGHRTCGGVPVLMAEAASAFLALHLAYIVGVALEMRPNLKIAGINIGVPVAALADLKTKGIIEQSMRVGLSLVTSAHHLGRNQVREVTDGKGPTLPYCLQAELSGAIAGYCTMPRHHRGAHMIIDCGSATLDMASFTLGDPTWPIGIHCAKVEPLGADSCLTYQSHGVDVEVCQRAARFEEHEVFRETICRAAGFVQDRGKFTYQIILIGGGIHSDTHAPLFERMGKAFHRPFHLPQVSRDLDYDHATDFGRLVLADGLARDPIDLREVAMPGDRPSPPPSPMPEMISKDQV